MPPRKFFYILFFPAIIFGALIFLIYFWPRPIKPVIPLIPAETAPDQVHFEPEKVFVPPPDYGANLEKPQEGNDADKPRDNNEIAPISPETEDQSEVVSMRIVGYRGVITKIAGFNLEFKPAVEGRNDLVAAILNEKTQITQVVLGAEAARTTISLQDLKPGDEVLISGLSRDYYQPIVNTTHIERFYLK